MVYDETLDEELWRSTSAEAIEDTMILVRVMRYNKKDVKMQINRWNTKSEHFNKLGRLTMAETALVLPQIRGAKEFMEKNFMSSIKEVTK